MGIAHPFFIYFRPMKYTAVIFDLGGVIIHIDYAATIHAFENLGHSDFHNVYSQAQQSGLFDELETGKISGQRFVNELLPYLKRGTSPNKVVAAWNAMIGAIPKERIALLQKVREKYPVYLLSNTNELHMQAVQRSWQEASEKPMSEFFDHIYLSHEIGMRKPNAEIFEFVCRENKLNPSETLFIDDSIQHIEGAKSCGLQTVHLTDFELLDQLFS
jgi:HAD superfamily hydrolase (TIGR01509 family)